jgi:hypothetical protein
VVQISDNKVPREVITIKDFHRVAKENEFFIWHFLQKNQCGSTLTLCSYFEERTGKMSEISHTIKYLFNSINVPYFESYTEESIDFLLDLGFKENFLFQRNPNSDFPVARERQYAALFIGFNRFMMVGSSPQKCYCSDYLIELIMELNPKFILDSNFD